MPRHVNHDQRRNEVIVVATDLVVERGRAALTVRNVAQAAGCSTKVVSHYFADMADLLHATYAAAASRAGARLGAVLDEDPGDVQGFLETLLPVDEERARDWTIWLSFWSEALPSDRLGADQAERSRATIELLALVLARLAERGDVTSEHDPHLAACRLYSMIQGLSSQATFDPQRWPPERQRAVVMSELELLGITSSAGVRWPS